MPTPLDLERALSERNEPVPIQFFAAALLMTFRDGADTLFIATDPDPGVTGALVQYRHTRSLYDLIPPPRSCLPHVLTALRKRFAPSHHSSDLECMLIPVTFAGVSTDVALVLRSRSEGLAVHLPIPHPFTDQARSVLVQVSKPDNTIEFDEDWANDPDHHH